MWAERAENVHRVKRTARAAGASSWLDARKKRRIEEESGAGASTQDTKRPKKRRKRTKTHPIMFLPPHPVHRHLPPLPVRTNPQIRMHLLLRQQLALEDMAVDEVVVHRLGDDGGDRNRLELEKGIMLGCAGL